MQQVPSPAKLDKSGPASKGPGAEGLIAAALCGLLILAGAGSAQEPSPSLDLVAERLELYRHENVFTAYLTISNRGKALARQVEVQVFMRGFQVIADRSGQYGPSRCVVEYDVSSGEGVSTMSLNADMEPGTSETVVFRMIPILADPNPPSPSLGHRVMLTHQGPTSDTQHTIETDLTVHWTSVAAGSGSPERVAAAHAAAVRACDYLVVTHPHRLFSLDGNTASSVNDLLSEMAEFASTRYAVLGYLNRTEDSDIRDSLKELIEPPATSQAHEKSPQRNQNWASQLHPAFTEPLQGYMLIVGETEIIPAWEMTGWNIRWPTWKCTTSKVQMTDLPYASPPGDDSPSLVLGRIIGDTAAGLSQHLRASDGFDRSHALLVSGLEGRAELREMFVDFVSNAEQLLAGEYSVRTLHWSEMTLGKVAAFGEAATNRDLIVYTGHGLPLRWGGLDESDFAGDAQAAQATPAISFGDEHPVVLAWACLTGSYEERAAGGDCGPFDGGDYGIAEVFLDNGAAVYVGSTEISPIRYNAEGAIALLRKWEPDKSAGYALTAVKRDMLSENPEDPYWRLWAAEYNLYGDPKYGATQMTAPSRDV